MQSVSVADLVRRHYLATTFHNQKQSDWCCADDDLFSQMSVGQFNTHLESLPPL